MRDEDDRRCAVKKQLALTEGDACESNARQAPLVRFSPFP
jgi:hypothetical protein